MKEHSSTLIPNHSLTLTLEEEAAIYSLDPKGKRRKDYMGQNPNLHTGTRRAGSTGRGWPVVPDVRSSGSTGNISGSTA